MNTHSWRVIAMDVRPYDGSLTDVVMRVSWEVTAHDPDVGDTAGTQGQTAISQPTSSFTSYAELTEAQVLGWVWGVMGDNQKTELENFVDALLIENRKPPLTQLPLPWA